MVFDEEAQTLLQEIARRPAGATCRISFVEIETPIPEGDEFGEPYVLTPNERELIRLTEAHFAEDDAA
jgi:hypothetical protein